MAQLRARAVLLSARTPELLATLAAALGLGIFHLVPSAAAAGLLLAALSAVAAPRIGLLATLALLPLHLQTRSIGPLAFSSSEAMLLAAAAGSGIRLIIPNSTFRPARAVGPLNLPIALFLSSALLSLLVTEYLRLSLRELRSLVLEPILAYYLLLAWFPGRAVVGPLLAFLAGVVGVALGGLVGMVFGLGLSEAEGVRRLQATYLSANHLGLLLGRGLPWMVALAWYGRGWRWAALAAAVVSLGALVATFSLGAWLGTGAALLVVGLALGGGRRLLLAVAAFALSLGVVVLLAPQRFLGRLQRGGTGFFRLQLWQSSLAMVRDHPVLGIGLDNFLYQYQQRYILPTALAEANLSHPHNLVLHFWLQLGLVGLAAALWLLTMTFRQAANLVQKSNDQLTRALAAGALGSLTDFAVHGLIDNSYFLPDLALVFWLTLALTQSLREETASARSSRGRPRQVEWRAPDHAARLSPGRLQ